jgi:hypothetical protein
LTAGAIARERSSLALVCLLAFVVCGCGDDGAAITLRPGASRESGSVLSGRSGTDRDPSGTDPLPAGGTSPRPQARPGTSVHPEDAGR